MPELLSDPWFYAAAIPAVILVGLSKGGLGGAMGFAGVPLMTLTISPIQAAAILLPILVLMDAVSLWSWRGNYDRVTLRDMLPGAMAGIALGWVLAAYVTVEGVRLVVGIVAITFVARWLYQKLWTGVVRIQPRNPLLAAFWATVSGFTSFVAHVGGPPYQVYALARGLDPKVFTGTAVIFFAVVNVVKLVPYFALGQFDSTNLMASLVLVPIAPLATLTGVWIVRRLRPDTFYAISYLTVAAISVKLVWDALADLL
jgi:uncharacterized membrane protein YfcA